MSITKEFIYKAPKAELHVHLTGTLEPEMALELASRNYVALSFSSVEEFKKKLIFANLQEFLDLTYEVSRVLVTEQDFFELTYAYLKRAHQNGVKHAEIFFDPQMYMSRGIAFDTMLSGISAAFREGEKLALSCALIVSFMRHMPVSAAAETLEQILRYKKDIIGVGLDSTEKNNPPEKFADIFQKALSHGLYTVAHAGEEGPVDYIWQALQQLKVSRIDHGNACIHDDSLIAHLARERIPLTMCPLSNLQLRVTSLESHPAKKLLDKSVCVTINSDDPAYFGGYISDNIVALIEAQNLSKTTLYSFLKNSFEASFLSCEQKNIYIQELDDYFDEHS